MDCEHKTAPIDESGEYFAVGTPAMRDNSINYSEARRINRVTYEAWTRRLDPKHGDILLAREAPVGPVVRIPAEENVAPGQRTVLLRPDPSAVDSQFLYYYLISPIRQSDLQVNASGSTVPHLNVADVRAFPTPNVPNLPEQRAIAEVLGALDDKIAANERAQRLASQLARALFDRAAKLGVRHIVRDVTEIITRGVTPKYTEDGGITVLNQKCVRNQRVNLAPGRATLSSSTRDNKMLRLHDVLVNSTGFGTLGRAARWIRGMDATVDSHISIVRFDANLVDPVCAGFGLLRLEKQIESLAEGSTGQTELRRDLLAGLEILVPRSEEQQAVGAELATLDAHALALEEESHMLAKTRDSLLSLLMSGKVRVRDAEKVVEEAV
ncbi:restriction endonuclease subunit S [Saccharopolyspora indica]|nr:restriction endonuclease subunit S [Saccharopolyspora indica]MDA3649322.1 restriction endonuclease subunit S [Saccharopolyspora indica]